MFELQAPASPLADESHDQSSGSSTFFPGSRGEHPECDRSSADQQHGPLMAPRVNGVAAVRSGRSLEQL